MILNLPILLSKIVNDSNVSIVRGSVGLNGFFAKKLHSFCKFGIFSLLKEWWNSFSRDCYNIIKS